MVTGTSSCGIDVSELAPGDPVSSPLETHFTHGAVSGGVVMQAWPDGAAEPIVEQFATSGGGFFAMDVWDTTVECAPAATGPAAAIYTSTICSEIASELPPTSIAVTAFRVEITN